MHSPVDSSFILVNKKQMIKNSQYTYDYQQPKEYRFSLDSVFLAQKAAQWLKSADYPDSILSEMRILDLCAGCGVIGMELHFYLKQLRFLDFLEVQTTYKPFFDLNQAMIQGDTSQFRFLQMNYADLKKDPAFFERYDVILSNPPYFFKDEGLLSPNEFKNRCRFFLDSDFENLILSLHYSLKKGAHAFLLVRPGIHHGRNLFEEIQLIAGIHQLNLKAEIFDEVRGTNIVMLTKEF